MLQLLPKHNNYLFFVIHDLLRSARVPYIFLSSLELAPTRLVMGWTERATTLVPAVQEEEYELFVLKQLSYFYIITENFIVR